MGSSGEVRTSTASTQHLINGSVPRPAKGQRNYSRWMQCSRPVASWLYIQVDKNIQERLQQLHRIPSKADALFDGIMKIVRQSYNVPYAKIKPRKVFKNNCILL